MNPHEHPTTAPRRPKEHIFLFVGLGVLAVAVIAGIWIFIATYGKESTDDAFIDAHIVPISAKVSGQVSVVAVTDNQPVKAGDILFTIDSRDYQAHLDEMQAKVASAEAETKRAASDAVRYAELFKNDEVSKQQLDQANATAATTKAALEQARAQTEQAALNLSYCVVRAPESGRVTRRNVEAGAYINVGQPLLSIVPDRVYITANYKETQLTYMRPGQPVTIEIDSYPGQTFTGHVDSIQSGTGERFSMLPPENATGNYVKVVQRVPVKIVMDKPGDPSLLLAPGMSVVPTVKVK
jgi:membrane fusion protein (multidrug efflux system)